MFPNFLFPHARYTCVNAPLSDVSQKVFFVNIDTSVDELAYDTSFEKKR
jgi:hypothetical protein